MLRALIVAALITSAGVAVAPAAQASGYKNCSAAHADGRYNIPKGDPDYKSSQDRDGDGIACEG